jgi:hypothetical protein
VSLPWSLIKPPPPSPTMTTTSLIPLEYNPSRPPYLAHQHLLRSSSTSSPAVSALSSNEELLPGMIAIRDANDGLHHMLEKVREQPYFRLYSVDILASCEYLPQELFECYTASCEIYPAEEGEVRRRTGRGGTPLQRPQVNLAPFEHSRTQ